MNTKYIIPELVWTVEDKPVLFAETLFPSEKKHMKYSILERYFNDVYKLFILKLTKFDSVTTVSEDENKKLKSLLNEIIYVKTLMAQGK